SVGLWHRMSRVQSPSPTPQIPNKTPAIWRFRGSTRWSCTQSVLKIGPRVQRVLKCKKDADNRISERDPAIGALDSAEFFRHRKKASPRQSNMSGTTYQESRRSASDGFPPLYVRDDCARAHVKLKRERYTEYRNNQHGLLKASGAESFRDRG